MEETYENMISNEFFPCMVGIFDGRNDNSGTSIYSVTKRKTDEKIQLG